MILVDSEDLQENTIYCLLWKRNYSKIKELYFFKVLEKRTDAIYHPAKYTVNCFYTIKNTRVQHSFIDYPLTVERDDTTKLMSWSLNNNGICFKLTDSEVDRAITMELI